MKIFTNQKARNVTSESFHENKFQAESIYLSTFNERVCSIARIPEWAWKELIQGLTCSDIHCKIKIIPK